MKTTHVLIMVLFVNGCAQQANQEKAQTFEKALSEAIFEDTYNEWKAEHRKDTLLLSKDNLSSKEVSDEDMEKINPGVTKQRILEVLGPSILSAKNLKTQCEVLYYCYRSKTYNRKVAGVQVSTYRTDFIPLVIANDKLVGYGWDFFDTYTASHPGYVKEDVEGFLKILSKYKSCY